MLNGSSDGCVTTGLHSTAIGRDIFQCPVGGTSLVTGSISQHRGWSGVMLRFVEQISGQTYYFWTWT